MSEATEAIKDIKEALAEYGSDITLKKVIKSGTYDPILGEYPTLVEEYPMKAFTPTFASEKLANNPLVKTSSYDAVFKLYHNEQITKEWKINYKGYDYTILVVDSSTLQNDTILYECVCKK